MNKKLIIFLSIFLLSSTVHAGIMNNRFVELRVDLPMDVSNNSFGILDLFRSEELLIDLGAVADELPEDGFTIRSSMTPNIGVNFNIAKFHAGLKVGADIYGSFNLDKSIFNFIAFGNKLNETVEIKPNVYGDVFITGDVYADLQLGRMKLNVNPALFIPVASINTNNTYLKIQNNSNGDIIAEMNGNIELYSQFALDETGNGIDINHISMGSETMDIRSSDALMKLFRYSGFDFAGIIELPSPIFDSLSFSAAFRVPIIPGKLNTKTAISCDTQYKINPSEIIQNKIDGNTENSENEGKELDLNLNDLDYTYYSEETVYKINRPFKFMGYATFMPFGELLTAKAGLGFAVRSPLSEYAVTYPQYYLGGGVSVLGGFFRMSLSTEYTNQIFIHQTNLAISLRAVEIDLGLGTEGPNFEKSFNLSGVRAYLGVAVGI